MVPMLMTQLANLGKNTEHEKLSKNIFYIYIFLGELSTSISIRHLVSLGTLGARVLI